MNISATETELANFIRKYNLLHELLIFKYWRQIISVSNIALHTAVMQALGQDSVRSIDIMNINIIHDVYGTLLPTEYARQCIYY